LILGPASTFLRVGPIWHTFYLPILLLAVASLLRSGITLARPHWVWFPRAAEMLQELLGLIMLNFMINAAAQAPGGDWHPFVVLADAAKNSAQYIRIAGIVNASILLSLAAAWLGVCIALAVQTWQLLRDVRERISGTGQPASLHVH